jgi:hypothetical protein
VRKNPLVAAQAWGNPVEDSERIGARPRPHQTCPGSDPSRVPDGRVERDEPAFRTVCGDLRRPQGSRAWSGLEARLFLLDITLICVQSSNEAEIAGLAVALSG